MALGQEIVSLARAHIGEKYVLGARAKFLDPEFAGPWDCAEFASWVIFQATKERVLLGCSPRDPSRADAYTGYWADDAKKYGLIISVDEAIQTAGALLLRTPFRGARGHIAISAGDGRGTIEAYDKKHGVIRGAADPIRRAWELGVRVPQAREWDELTAAASKTQNWFLRATESRVADPRVPSIEAALRRKRVALPNGRGSFTPVLAKSIEEFQAKNGLVVDGMVGRQTSRALGLTAASAPSGTYNDKYGVFFDSLVAGGFYSSNPDDLSIRRSIRTNNPGALNFSAWQRRMKGYVGITPPDNSPDRNRTTIYRTPEHGVAAWFELLSERYGFRSKGSFGLTDLARKYAGSSAGPAAIRAYVNGWSRSSGGTINANSTFRTQNTAEMLELGKAMFAHEIGRKSPLQDAQIRFGIDRQRQGTMPD